MAVKDNGRFIGVSRKPQTLNARGVYGPYTIDPSVRSYDWPVSANTVVSSGLQMHLDAANSSSYPGSGSTWTDLTGNGNNITLVNSPSFDSANGGSIYFAGVNQYGFANHSSTINATTISISIWINSTSPSTGNGGEVIGKHNASGSLNGWAINCDAGNLPYGYFKNATTYYDTSTSTRRVPNNEWVNIVWVQVPSTYLKMYINGTLTGTNNSIGGVTTNGDALRIADSNDTFWSIFIGNISHILYYNKELSQTEITQNFNAIRGRYNL